MLYYSSFRAPGMFLTGEKGELNGNMSMCITRVCYTLVLQSVCMDYHWYSVSIRSRVY